MSSICRILTSSDSFETLAESTEIAPVRSRLQRAAELARRRERLPQPLQLALVVEREVVVEGEGLGVLVLRLEEVEVKG